jgi:hypothetical protein
MQPDKEPFYAEKYLLSMWQCGCYINTQNIIDMGSSLGLELSFKKRSSLLQALLLYVKELHKEQQFLSLISDLLDHKVQTLHHHVMSYPKTALFMQPYIAKIEKTKYLLNREFALSTKDENE